MQDVLHQRPMQGRHVLEFKREVAVCPLTDINIGDCLSTCHEQGSCPASEVGHFEGCQFYRVGEILFPFRGEREFQQKRGGGNRGVIGSKVLRVMQEPMVDATHEVMPEGCLL